MTKRRKPAPPSRGPEGDRVTYRELRNTPGRVWERLADGGPLTLVADGEAKAIVIPIRGDPAAELEAYRRGRAIMAMWKLQADSAAKGTDKLTLAQINAVIRNVRRQARADDDTRSRQD